MAKRIFKKRKIFTLSSILLLLFSTLHSEWIRDEIRAGIFPHGVCTGDFNGDGYVDLAVAGVKLLDENVYLLMNRGGVFEEPKPFLAGDGSYDIVSADFDGDESMDFAVISSQDEKIRIYTNNEEGLFVLGFEGKSGEEPRTICSADFDNDGDIDIAVTNFSVNKISIFWNE